MKKVFDFMSDNFEKIYIGVLVVLSFVAVIFPLVYGLSTLLWRWALNPYMPC